MNEDWIKVENFINEDTAQLLYGYILLAHRRLSVMKQMNYTTELFGDFDDPQALGDYSKYGDLIFDTLLLGKREQLEEITNMKLTPQYTYHRLYTHGTELKRHKDRESCEISLTLCLGYDADYKWPIWFKDKNNKEISVETDVGDMIIYKGNELEHWREPFRGEHHAQVFLHYNEQGGKFDGSLYDDRPALGFPLKRSHPRGYRGLT